MTVSTVGQSERASVEEIWWVTQLDLSDISCMLKDLLKGTHVTDNNLTPRGQFRSGMQKSRAKLCFLPPGQAVCRKCNQRAQPLVSRWNYHTQEWLVNIMLIGAKYYRFIVDKRRNVRKMSKCYTSLIDKLIGWATSHFIISLLTAKGEDYRFGIVCSSVCPSVCPSNYPFVCVSVISWRMWIIARKWSIGF